MDRKTDRRSDGQTDGQTNKRLLYREKGGVGKQRDRGTDVQIGKLVGGKQIINRDS